MARKPKFRIEDCVVRWNKREGDDCGIYVANDADRSTIGGILNISDAVDSGIHRNTFIFDETLPPGTMQITPK
jgi:hypothetical protein